MTIITTPANPLMAEIHNAKARMPAILRREDHEAWLSDTQDEALACLKPYREERMRAHAVSRAVNSPVNDGPELIRAVGAN